jgi:hypothetical protein
LLDSRQKNPISCKQAFNGDAGARRRLPGRDVLLSDDDVDELESGDVAPPNLVEIVEEKPSQPPRKSSLVFIS